MTAIVAGLYIAPWAGWAAVTGSWWAAFLRPLLTVAFAVLALLADRRQRARMRQAPATQQLT